MQQKTILIVDDSIIIIERVAEILKDLDSISGVTQVHSYDEAMESLKQQRPDIVLLDINLPGTNGIELLRHLKQSDPSITVIMFSNRGNAYYKDLCKRLGADFFVDKSRGFEQLPGIISALP
ncbi:MAG: response regulator [Bacteroidetes bacterium]|nr:response regulator [Bacteroidota bacterium]